MKKVMIGSIVFLVVLLIGFQVFSIRATPIIKAIADKEMHRFCQLIVNHASFPYTNISKDLVTIERDNNNQISFIDFDMAYASKIAGEIVLNIEQLLLELEEGEYIAKDDSIYNRKLEAVNKEKGVIAKVPLGVMSNNPFFASMGPHIKIKYQTISEVSSSIIKEVKDYGINRMMVGISIVITIKLMVVFPFYKDEFTQDITFPLSLEIIEGQVPQWYQN